jgi:metal transporter CNNM
MEVARFLAANVTSSNSTSQGSESSEIKLEPWLVYLLLVVLLAHSAFFSGNNIGVLAMDIRYIELMTKGPFETVEEERQAKMAEALIPMKKRGYQILVMILFMVSILNTAISILMADIEGSLSGFLISTTLIVIFAEILPQVLVNRWTVVICYYSRYIMYFYFALTFIFVYPAGIILDKIFGEDEGFLLSKSRMKKLF